VMGVAGQVIVLAVVQSLTEFLPISSSAHLILVPWILGWQHLGLIFDVSLHLGTLAAILVYFRRDWATLIRDLPGLFRRDSRSLLPVLMAGAIPAGIFGLAAGDFIEARLRGPGTIAVCLAGFGLLMWEAERRGRKVRKLSDAGVRDGFWIGVFQMLALIPGVSRSGITISGGLLRGFEAWDAARLSFLLSAPAIAGAGLLKGLEAYHEYLKGPQSLEPLMHQPHPVALLLLGITVSAVAGLLCIRYFLRYLQTGSLVPFVIYRLVLAASILGAVWRGGG